MITREEYKQYKAYTRQDGLLLGLLMAVTFISLMMSMQTPGIQIVTMSCFIATPLMVIHCIRRYRDRILQKTVSYKRALGYSMACFAYGALILAFASYIYMRFIDCGAFIGYMTDNLTRPEMDQVLKAYGLSKAQATAELEAIAALRPIDVAFSLITNVFITGFMASLVIALIGKGEPKVIKSS